MNSIKKLARVDGLRTKIALPCERQEALGDRSATHAGFEGRMVILAEPTIATGDCRIEWADGGVVLDRAAIEAKISELVGRYLASRNEAARP